MNITGKLVAITEAKKVNDTITTQSFVVEYEKPSGKDKTRTVQLAFEQRQTATYNSIEKWKNVKVGDVVEVQFNEPESTEWNGKYFTKVEAWSVKSATKPNGGTASNTNDDSDILPF